MYPAVEYDFVPNDLTISASDLLHIQWSGSNSHANKAPGGDGQTGDDGQGKSGTDRHNFVQIPSPNHNFPVPFEKSSLFKNMKWVWSSTTHGTPPDGAIEDLALYFAFGGFYHCRAKCEKSLESGLTVDAQLNLAPASAAGHVIQLNPGSYFYACTRYTFYQLS